LPLFIQLACFEAQISIFGVLRILVVSLEGNLEHLTFESMLKLFQKNGLKLERLE